MRKLFDGFAVRFQGWICIALGVYAAIDMAWTESRADVVAVPVLIGVGSLCLAVADLLNRRNEDQ
jgi:hypothetical protein